MSHSKGGEFSTAIARGFEGRGTGQFGKNPQMPCLQYKLRNKSQIFGF